jgi:DNA-directed RNA polymerase specialized sigma24 family protein
MRKTPAVQQQQQRTDAGQPVPAAAAAADAGTMRATGTPPGGQLLLVGREKEIFQAALEALPPQEAQNLMQVCQWAALLCCMCCSSA